MDLRVKVHVLVVGATLMLGGTAIAAPLDDAGAASGRGDYATALRLLKPLAAKGLPAAQNMLGALFEQGKGVPKSYATAAKWYARAAKQGNVTAEDNLGFLYDHGLGVQQDAAAAAKWYRKAAEQGDALAQTTLGGFFAAGHGVLQDYREANSWFRRAAIQGNADGETNLGISYELGHGVPPAPVEAAVWYSAAAEQGAAEAQYDLAMLYMTGRGVSVDYAQAAEWFGKAADQGNANAERELGALYQFGRGVPVDYAKAAEFYVKAAAQGDALAKYDLSALPATQSNTGPSVGVMDVLASPANQVEPNGVGPQAYEVAKAAVQHGDYATALNLLTPLSNRGDPAAETLLAFLYSKGWGITQDDGAAVVWYRRAASQGFAAAQYLLGVAYATGRGVQQDLVRAATLYRAAATQGHDYAENNLGGLYEEGKGVSQNYVEAAIWFGKAAERGNASAEFNLGNLYLQGKGVAQSYVTAAGWFRKSADGGFARAQTSLGELYVAGNGVARDYVDAAKLFEQAANQGDGLADRDLGVLYEHGRGVPIDYAKARDFYEQAAERGDAIAEGYLAALPPALPIPTRIVKSINMPTLVVPTGAFKVIGTTTGPAVQANRDPILAIPVLAEQDDKIIERYRLTLSLDGRSLTVTGGVRFGLARDIDAAIEANPGITTIVLNSDGGREAEAQQVLQVIRKRGLDTYVSGDCLSACTLIFVAGKHRALSASARLGFHAGYSANAVPPSEAVVRFMHSVTIGSYMNAGVDRGFMERVVAIPGSSMWFPTRAELVAAHVLIDDADSKVSAVPVGTSATTAGSSSSRSFDAVH